MKKRLVIFDMDGTLQDSSDAIANAINHVRSRLMLPPMRKETIIRKINDPYLNPAEFFYESERFEPRHEEWFSEYYSANHRDELRLYDGVDDLLRELKERGCLIGLATNAYRRSTVESLSHLGIDRFFDALACYDDVEHGKPSPEMLLRILGELSVEAENAVFVGDGHRDRIAARKAGIDFLTVNWGFSVHMGAIGKVEDLKETLLDMCS